MTDLEMTKLCAEAMGYQQRDDSEDLVCWDYKPHEHMISVVDPSAPPIRSVLDYDPLCRDEQAMALVKRCRLSINAANKEYQVWPTCVEGEAAGKSCTFNADINRAIVGCVAKMRTLTTVTH
jgi:hypothetical protein